MIKIISLFAGSILCSSCASKHKTPEEIYSSGKVENFNDFVRTDTIVVKDKDTLVDEYVYKYDTAFKVEKMYTFTYSTQKKTFRNFSFLHHGKYEGKVTFYDPDGSEVGVSHYKNGERVSLESGK